MHKYSANDPVIIELSNMISSINDYKFLNIGDNDLDKIISKYYIDFLLDKTDDLKIGYSHDERLEFRNNIKSIITDIVNKNIPTNYIS